MYSIDVSKPITCLMAGRMQQHSVWEHNGRRHPSANILVFVIDGEVTFTVDNTSYAASRGSIVVIPKNTFYTANTSTVCEYYFFHFRGTVEKCTEAKFFAPRTTDFSFRVQPIVYDRIYFENGINVGDNYNAVLLNILSCFEYNALGTTYGRYMLDNEFMKLLLFMYGQAENRAGSDKFPLLVDKIIMYVKKNITKRLTVAEICEEHKISTSYAARVFKKHVGSSLGEYICKEKMHYAKELITHSTMNLSEIADYLSFCDVFYFSKLFKRTFGMNPSELKRQR